jgi:hypothetical protein
VAHAVSIAPAVAATTLEGWSADDRTDNTAGDCADRTRDNGARACTNCGTAQRTVALRKRWSGKRSKSEQNQWQNHTVHRRKSPDKIVDQHLPEVADSRRLQRVMARWNQTQSHMREGRNNVAREA